MKLISASPMFKYCVFILVFITSAITEAIEVDDLYQANINVDSQNSNERNKALKKALKAVIIKVGGQVEVLKHPLIKQAIVNYKSYVSQYSYNRVDEQLQLIASFDENKVNQLFQGADLPLWGSLRPQLLLWLIDEQGFERDILAESDNSTLPNLVNDFANERGLPITLPLMDFTDASQINIADIWGRFSEPVKAASARYSAEGIIIVRVSNSSLLPVVDEMADCKPLCSNNNVVLDWSLITEEQVFSEQYQGTKQATLLTLALSDITTLIYQTYALSTTANDEFLIEVANVSSIKSYMEISTFLANLSSVKSIKLVKAEGNTRRFSLNLLGSKNALMASLKLNKKLQQFIDPLGEITPDAIPVFYWDKL